jgi:hypothetical protein
VCLLQVGRRGLLVVPPASRPYARPIGRFPSGRGNQLEPSEYFRRNFAITTSGVEDPLALRFAIDKLGVDSVMWAIDHPYQPTAPAVAFIDAPLGMFHVLHVR